MKRKYIIGISIILLSAPVVSCSNKDESINNVDIPEVKYYERLAPEPKTAEEALPDGSNNYYKDIHLGGGLSSSGDGKIFLYTTYETHKYLDMLSALINDGYEILDITITDDHAQTFSITYKVPEG